MAEEEKATSEPAPSEAPRMEPAPSEAPRMEPAPSVVSMMAHQPKKPVMGGLFRTDDNKWMAWTGGKPKLDWSGFADDARVDFRAPNQMRPLYDVKGYNHRKTGFTAKFNKSDLLIPFKKRVWTHLKDNGLDSISYLPDMRNEMSCVIYDHSRYTLESAKMASEAQTLLYDKHDDTNDDAAIAFLLDSLAPALAEIISEKLEDSDSFHIVWLELMNEIQVQTVERIESIKKEIKDRRPQQYPGQDLEKLAVEFRAGAMELANAGQYEHNLTLTMLKTFLLAGGIDNEDFRWSLRGLKSKLDDELLAIGYMGRDQADAHMVRSKLTYKDINAAATKAYRKQKDRGEWPPAKNLPDSKAPPTGYGANVAETKTWCGTQAEVLAMIQDAGNDKAPWTGTEAEVLALIKQSGGGPKSGTTCHNCGKEGHWSRECKEARTDRRNSGIQNWKKTPPAVGTPATKLANGKTFKWCAKCVRWTTTHDTASHTGGRTDDRTEANLGLVNTGAWDNIDDASAWHFGINDTFCLQDIWDRFGPYIKLLQFGLLFYFSPLFFNFIIKVLFAFVA